MAETCEGVNEAPGSEWGEEREFLFLYQEKSAPVAA